MANMRMHLCVQTSSKLCDTYTHDYCDDEDETETIANEDECYDACFTAREAQLYWHPLRGTQVKQTQ
jgi:hypothetical protein